VEPFDFAVGLGPAGSRLLDGGAGRCTGAVPEPGFVAGAVVGDDAFTVDADRPIPSGGPAPESGCGCGLLVVVDLGVDDAAAVIDGGVEVAVPDFAALGAGGCPFP
jgi:hypothetical protein